MKRAIKSGLSQEDIRIVLERAIDKGAKGVDFVRYNEDLVGWTCKLKPTDSYNAMSVVFSFSPQGAAEIGIIQYAPMSPGNARDIHDDVVAHLRAACPQVAANDYDLGDNCISRIELAEEHGGRLATTLQVQCF